MIYSNLACNISICVVWSINYALFGKVGLQSIPTLHIKVVQSIWNFHLIEKILSLKYSWRFILNHLSSPYLLFLLDKMIDYLHDTMSGLFLNHTQLGWWLPLGMYIVVIRELIQLKISCCWKYRFLLKKILFSKLQIEFTYIYLLYYANGYILNLL